MEEVTRAVFDKAVRENAKFAMPNTPTGDVWTYYGMDDKRVGMVCGHKYWLENDVLSTMESSK